MRHFILATCVAALISCSEGTKTVSVPSNVAHDSAGIQIVENSAPAWQPGEEWWTDSLSSVRISEPTEGDKRYSLVDVTSAGRLADGRYVVVSRKSHEVQLFDHSGAFVRLLGRRGEGPGEYLSPDHVSILGDSISITSGGDYFGPLNVFDTLGHVLLSERVAEDGLRKAVGPGRYWEQREMLPDGSYVALVTGNDSAYRALPAGALYRPMEGFYHVLRDGRVDSLGWFVGMVELKDKPGASSIRTTLPLYLIRSYAAGGGDPLTVFAGSGESRDLNVYGTNGKLVRIIRRLNMPIAIDEKSRTAAENFYLGEVHSAADSAALRESFAGPLRQENYPTLDRLLVDAAGNVWTSSSGGWDVYDTSGRWLGNPKIGYGKQIVDIGRDYLTVLGRDADGVESVLEYKLHKEKRPSK